MNQYTSRKNTFEVKGEIIECYSQDGELLFFTNSQLEAVIKKHRWGKMADGYSFVTIDKRQILAHRFFTNAPEGMLVDHINRDKKDNRLENLRVCGRPLNAMNSKIREDNKSGCTGVWFRSDTKKWVAEIKMQYKKKSLGCYKTREEAAAVRKEAEHEYQLEAERQGW